LSGWNIASRGRDRSAGLCGICPEHRLHGVEEIAIKAISVLVDRRRAGIGLHGQETAFHLAGCLYNVAESPQGHSREHGGAERGGVEQRAVIDRSPRNISADLRPETVAGAPARQPDAVGVDSERTNARSALKQTNVLRPIRDDVFSHRLGRFLTSAHRLKGCPLSGVAKQTGYDRDGRKADLNSMLVQLPLMAQV